MSRAAMKVQKPCPVVGVPAERWGETPVAFVVLRAGAQRDAPAMMAWVNQRVGKTQRIAAHTHVKGLGLDETGAALPIGAGLVALTAFAMPMFLPVVVIAILWQLHRRARPVTWLLT